MKPSFALSLSFQGIRLLHRAAGGWRLVGEAALDAADLAAELAGLRDSALALGPDDLRTKILLPNEQIKYLSIDTPGLSPADRRDAAAQALNGATPYAVADLAFDISAEGDRTHIAAVAQETLDEAEAFATEHRFNPVSFAAIPDDVPYLGEPHFGATKVAATLLAADETVEPDGIAVVVIGEVADVATAEPTEPAEPEPAEPEPVEPEPVARAEPEPSQTKAETAVLVQEQEPAPAIPPAPPVTETGAEPPSVNFSSRRAGGSSGAPKLGGATRAPPPAPARPAETEPLLLGQADIAAESIPVEPDRPTFVAPPATQEPAPAPRSGFLSRRRAKPAKPDGTPGVIPAAPAPVAATDGSEQERMTIFGARRNEIGGKPRFLGLILTAALLVFLAGVAAWASVFLDDGLNFSRLFGDRSKQEKFSDAPPEEIAPATPQAAIPQPETPTADDPPVVTASLSPALTDEDTAVLDALQEPLQPAAPPRLSEDELVARYAATGIWPVAPVVPAKPARQIDLDDLYLTSIDPVSTAADAIALPVPDAFDTDAILAAIASPPAAGTQFALDAEGLVIPTAQGALSPGGFSVFLGRPPAVPPATPTRFESAPQDTAVRSALAALRPQPRPADLVENTERALLDGLTRSELAAYRPELRPLSLQEQARVAAATPDTAEPVPSEATNGAVVLALAEPSPFDNPTRLAARASLRPDPRPRNFARIVRRAERSKPAENVRVASAAAVAPRVVQPKIPTRTSVAKQATVKNAINLRKINLIGVYGKPSNRRALVRLENGRYKKVVVGDKIDGGRISAIGDSELRYTKRGRDLVLKMPR